MSLPGGGMEMPCSAQINYRSIGTDPGILHQDGLATINASSSIVNFSAPASIPTYVGQGDRHTVFELCPRELAMHTPVHIKIQQAGCAGDFIHSLFTRAEQVSDEMVRVIPHCMKPGLAALRGPVILEECRIIRYPCGWRNRPRRIGKHDIVEVRIGSSVESVND